jgi:hypothetical protein
MYLSPGKAKKKKKKKTTRNKGQKKDRKEKRQKSQFPVSLFLFLKILEECLARAIPPRGHWCFLLIGMLLDTEALGVLGTAHQGKDLGECPAADHGIAAQPSREASQGGGSKAKETSQGKQGLHAPHIPISKRKEQQKYAAKKLEK